MSIRFTNKSLRTFEAVINGGAIYLEKYNVECATCNRFVMFLICVYLLTVDNPYHRQKQKRNMRSYVLSVVDIFQIDGLSRATCHAVVTALYDSFVGKTIRCNSTDNEDVIQELQTQLDEIESHF